MADATWYLGPLGDLRELVCPEPGMTLSQVSYGGIHQGLSGARTMDFSGTKAEYEFEINNLTKDEWAWLSALNTRMVPGPFYLVDPFKKNRLSVQACKMVRPLTQYPQIKYELSYDFPSALPYPIQSLRIKSWEAYDESIPIMFDRGYVLPVTPGELITASVYMKASAAANGKLSFDYLDRTGATVSTYQESKTTVTSWLRNSMSRQIPSGVYGIRFYYQTLAPRTELYFCAPQVEVNAEATDWEQGGGANTVIIESLDTNSRIFPLRDTTLKLLEA